MVCPSPRTEVGLARLGWSKRLEPRGRGGKFWAKPFSHVNGRRWADEVGSDEGDAAALIFRGWMGHDREDSIF